MDVDVAENTITASNLNTVDSLLSKPWGQRSIEEQQATVRLGVHKPSINFSVGGKTYVHDNDPNVLDPEKKFLNKEEWITISESSKNLYCFPCLLFSTARSCWKSEGYSTTKFRMLKNAIKKHTGETSGHEINKKSGKCAHKEAVVSLKLFTETRALPIIISEAALRDFEEHNAKVKRNRELLRRHINAVLFLAKSENSFRGHNENVSSENRGGFKELLSYTAQYDDALRDHLNTATVFKGDSKSIQNDLIRACADVVREEIVREVTQAPFYSHIIDETTDVENSNQMSTTLRFVLDGVIKERFWGFKNVSKCSGATSLTTAILEETAIFNPKEKLVCQSYDGATLMSGKRAGVQALVLEVCLMALYIHCLAHKLNLALQHSVSRITDCKIFFSTVTGFHTFFNRSYKRVDRLKTVPTAELEEIPNPDADDIVEDPSASLANTTGVPRRVRTIGASTTRWSYSDRSVGVLYRGRTQFINCFDSIVDDDSFDGDTVCAAEGFSLKLQDFKFVFLLMTFEKVFSITRYFFNVLQMKALHIGWAGRHVDECLDSLLNLRTDDKFTDIYSKNPVSPHNDRRAPKRNRIIDFYSGFTTERTDLTHVQRYKVLYFEIIDNIYADIKDRFKNLAEFQFFALLDHNLFVKYDKEFPEELFNKLKNSVYKDLFCFPELRSDLLLLYGWKGDSLRKRIDELANYLFKTGLTDTLASLYKLLQLCMTMSFTVCSTERSYSALKRIKSRLRNTMLDERLSNLALLSIESKLAASVDIEKIIDRFASYKDRRIPLVFKTS